MEPDTDTEATSTWVNFAVVVRAPIERIPAIRRAIQGLSGQVFHEDIVPRDVLLWIVRKNPDHFVPRDQKERGRE